MDQSVHEWIDKFTGDPCNVLVEFIRENTSVKGWQGVGWTRVFKDIYTQYPDLLAKALVTWLDAETTGKLTLVPKSIHMNDWKFRVSYIFTAITEIHMPGVYRFIAYNTASIDLWVHNVIYRGEHYLNSMEEVALSWTKLRNTVFAKITHNTSDQHVEIGTLTLSEKAENPIFPIDMICVLACSCSR